MHILTKDGLSKRRTSLLGLELIYVNCIKFTHQTFYNCWKILRVLGAHTCGAFGSDVFETQFVEDTVHTLAVEISFVNELPIK